MMRSVLGRFERGGWQITQADEEYYIYYQSYGELPQLMLVVKGKDTFDTLAETMTVLYSLNHPEVEWDENLLNEIESILPE